MGQRSGTLKGIKIASGAPCISHLLFADDTMFFCKANEHCILNIGSDTLSKLADLVLFFPFKILI